MALANSTLQAIINKVRLLTRSPSEAVLSTDAIELEINNFILYDFPQHLQLFPLHTTFFFFCQPNIDTYVPLTESADIENPLYQFDQRYTTFSGPVYVAGLEAKLSQSREEFYRIYPFTNSVQMTQLVGNGVQTSFSGTLQQTPVLRNQVTFTAIDASNNGLVLYDNGEGMLLNPEGVPNQTYGTIDYITGAFTLEFLTPPAASAPIYSETYPYVTGIPIVVLYYDNQFVLRPVPDKAYKIILNAYIRPTQLLETDQSPKIQQWWTYIAYGAAKKIFENRMDLESVQLIMPEYKKQEALVLRTTLIQQSNQRVATIYTTTGQNSGFNPYGNAF